MWSCLTSQQLYRMLTCSPFCVPELPHITASSCTGVSLVASALLLFLQEVAEPDSGNPSGVSSPRVRRCQGFLLQAGTISTTEMKRSPIAVEVPNQGCGFLEAENKRNRKSHL